MQDARGYRTHQIFKNIYVLLLVEKNALNEKFRGNMWFTGGFGSTRNRKLQEHNLYDRLQQRIVKYAVSDKIAYK